MLKLIGTRCGHVKMTDPDNPLVFSGDGKCPHCLSYCTVEWFKSTASWACQCCNYELDLAGAIRMCAVYRPERNSHDIRGTLDRIGKAVGLNLVLTEPPRPRSFFHPIEFAKNFAVGLMIGALWRRIRDG